jgi:hypothetical protein
MLKIFFTYILIVIHLLLTVSCNAPRNNLLDPENPDNKISTLEGFVKTVKVPRTPLENAEIYWKNDGLITNSDKDGYFKLDNLERRDGWLTISKENYSPDSLFVEFNNQKKIIENIFLNAIPQINELYFYSITINKFPSSQRYNLEVIANITDDENDIDSVFIENAELNVHKQLIYNPTFKVYMNSLLLSDLNVASIDAVIGKEFQITVFDTDQKKFVIGNSNIKRIIKEEIETTSPSGRDTVYTKSPFFEWRRFTPGFDFSYLLEIYTDEIQPNIIFQTKLFSSDINHQTVIKLVKGDYFWVIWAIDEFNNRTRSKPASFIIK